MTQEKRYALVEVDNIDRNNIVKLEVRYYSQIGINKLCLGRITQKIKTLLDSELLERMAKAIEDKDYQISQWDDEHGTNCERDVFFKELARAALAAIEGR
jgi:hypothetical protein